MNDLIERQPVALFLVCEPPANLDQATARCETQATAWGFTCQVWNLWPFPRRSGSPIQVIRQADLVVAAWGSQPEAMGFSTKEISDLCHRQNKRLVCLGIDALGHPITPAQAPALVPAPYGWRHEYTHQHQKGNP